MMTLEEVKEELTRYSLAKVARKSGVDRHVLYRMMKEKAKPSYDAVKKLSDWLEGQQQ
jgi:DNA-binding phage protein